MSPEEIKSALEKDVQKIFDSTFGQNWDKYVPYNEQTLLILKEQIRTVLHNAVTDKRVVIDMTLHRIYIDKSMCIESVIGFLPLVFPNVRWKQFSVIAHEGEPERKYTMIGTVKYAGEPYFHFHNGTLDMDSRCIFQYAQKIKKVYLRGVIGDGRSECK